MIGSGIGGIPARWYIRWGRDPDHGSGDAVQLGRDARHVLPAGTIPIRPQHHIEPGQGEQRVAARDGGRARDGADDRDVQIMERVRSPLALHDHGPIRPARNEVVDAVQGEGRGRDAAQALAAVTFPPQALGAIGVIEPDMLDALGG